LVFRFLEGGLTGWGTSGVLCYERFSF